MKVQGKGNMAKTDKTGGRAMKRNAGFSLIEMMIVVEIIGILVALTVPSLLRTKMQSNEASAVANLKVVLQAQITYNGANTRYAGAFNELTDASPPFLAGEWTVERNGYTYRLEGDGNTFIAHAIPASFGVTGWNAYCVDPTGVVHYAPGAVASVDGPVLGQI
jgi:prepilin-type N-terminal cleavage/methylation domain-containing protein